MRRAVALQAVKLRGGGARGWPAHRNPGGRRHAAFVDCPAVGGRSRHAAWISVGVRSLGRSIIDLCTRFAAIICRFAAKLGSGPDNCLPDWIRGWFIASDEEVTRCMISSGFPILGGPGSRRFRRPPLLPTDMRGRKRPETVDDRPVPNGIVHALRRGGRRADCAAIHGPKKTLCNRFGRRAGRGIREGILSAPADTEVPPDRLFIDSSRIRVHRCAARSICRACAEPGGDPANHTCGRLRLPLSCPPRGPIRSRGYSRCSVTPVLITVQVTCSGRFCHIGGGRVLVLSLPIVSLSNTFQHPFEGPSFLWRLRRFDLDCGYESRRAFK